METKASLSRIVVIITALFAALSGIYLLVGGIWLAKLGGSLYYIIAGVISLVTAWLLYRRRSSALLLYAIFLFGTTVWAVWEVGTDFWALTPRLDVTFFLGLWILLPVVYNQMLAKNAFARGALAVSLLFTVIVLAYSVFNDPQEINGTLKAADAAPAATDSGVPASDWPAYGRTQGGTRYSPLNQINDKNVSKLDVAWTFRTGDLKTPNDPGEITDEVTPIKIGDMLYLCTPHQKLFALDAATGKEKWKFDPQLNSNPTFQHVTCRGVSYHETTPAAQGDAANGAAPAVCSRRIILPVNDGRLFALDAETGARCPAFGNNGELNLQGNMPYATPGHYEPTSPPIITKSVIIVAGAVTDNYSNREPSGVIRGFDVETGKLLWAFDPGAAEPNKIPEDGQHFTPNSPNSWAPAAYDDKLDLVYLPIGVATPDIWGGNRTPEMERYASGLLALNATTGKLAWFYQTVHHDLWDMDVPAQPTLADITDKSGNKVPAIYVPTKTGNIFVLDRRDGKLIVDAPEKPVPQGAAKGDHVSPTQPFSELTFRPEAKLTGKDMWGATIYDQLMCRVIFHKLRYEGTFTPPSEQGTLVFPGNLGMFEWGGISVDTDRQVAIANPIALPFVSKLIPRGPGNPMEPDENDKGGSGTETGIQPQYGVPFGVTLNPFLSPLGFPCKQPSWGYISGVDLKTNDIVWKKRIGTVRDSSPLPLPFKMGMPMLGAPISTAGNVFFIAATADNYLRAFDMSNGDKLWEARLPAGGQATPMTYSVNGKQYVVIAAGGHGSFGTKLGDYIIAYALPDADAK
ncbi:MULTISPECIES: glucose/quinate/shikimate family membrane-bound PQQ-dependent dehydrogenase [Rahnella]|jgi:quinoprotein glucose dehydrogenase|uniref:Glucose/quinate/shikimate family membrane-bound PQQ-dependent dehydrogenase n=2 Tax=Rahnella TaxID=34037 RepID=A0A0H3FGB9_RAHSY|nr:MULTISPECIES: glucose/quinate/shikimate family membrane-bound PQQ-dependent dehydrogenase [Rahnella]ABM68634.1 quinoprotein glucose dehydrogenase [Rahnella aquatilis HX2]QBJ07206.1 glucose/quinate/shikimate family membrane-bound PQQ-dependent dehydrogenase [Rahnella aquatilis]ADW76357.1 membrane-bound PQQ-dependent dehydrogenase, glucose/quinate/shikimate family [Rahnella aceris]AFE61035.1 glucose dehydrogenase [Rahnella aquatilis HX2]MBU9863479.1 glucose/quinate/shikimate family membrane-b